jgi:hypothetical protein
LTVWLSSGLDRGPAIAAIGQLSLAMSASTWLGAAAARTANQYAQFLRRRADVPAIPARIPYSAETLCPCSLREGIGFDVTAARPVSPIASEKWEIAAKISLLGGEFGPRRGKLHGLASHASAKIDHRILARPGSAFRCKSPGHLARIKMGYSDELPLLPVALVALVRAVIEGAGR